MGLVISGFGQIISFGFSRRFFFGGEKTSLHRMSESVSEEFIPSIDKLSSFKLLNLGLEKPILEKLDFLSKSFESSFESWIVRGIDGPEVAPEVGNEAFWFSSFDTEHRGIDSTVTSNSELQVTGVRGKVWTVVSIENIPTDEKSPFHSLENSNF